MMKPIIRFTFTIAILLAGITRAAGQTAIPEVLEKGTITEQMNYLEEKTRIYEYYRAIREDMFQMIKRNAVDSLVKVKNQVNMLAGMNSNLVLRFDSLTATLSDREAQLDEAIRTKDGIKVFGMNLNKKAYNSIMWIIVVGLLFLLGLGFLIFKRNLSVMLRTKKDLEEMKTEFESYRQKKRLEIEKLGMDHFNELKKLKGG
ncbi:MAG: hypothetical protein NTW82_09620 [Bacteroidia bacterium]|nr:hypothetical protein [Bacteroidia bacterium]